MLTVDMMLRRAMKGELDLLGPAMAVSKELMSIPDFGTDSEEEFFSTEMKIIKNLKKACLLVSGAAVQKLMQNLKDEQEVLMNLADMLIELYTVESAALRTLKIVNSKSEQAASIQIDMARIYLYFAAEKIHSAGREAIYAFAEGDEQKMMLMGLRRFTKMQPWNLKEARRRVADFVIHKNDYPF
jgi:hypothetical protein